VTFDLDCDVIPSSNPSSSVDAFSQDDFFDEPQLFYEEFLKENIDSFKPELGM